MISLESNLQIYQKHEFKIPVQAKNITQNWEWAHTKKTVLFKGKGKCDWIRDRKGDEEKSRKRRILLKCESEKTRKRRTPSGENEIVQKSQKTREKKIVSTQNFKWYENPTGIIFS